MDPNNNPTPEPDPTPTPEPEPTPTPEPSPEDELPEWARKALRDARADAANYRVKAREANEKLANAKTPEDIEAAVAELRKTNEELEHQIVVRDVAATYKLPPELASVLQGTTKEELDAHAKVLAKFAAPPAPVGDPTGGLTPGTEPESNDPRELARLARRL